MKNFSSPRKLNNNEENEKWADEEQLMSFDRVELDRNVNKGKQDISGCEWVEMQTKRQL